MTSGCPVGGRLLRPRLPRRGFRGKVALREGFDANPNIRALDYSDWTSIETRRIGSQVAPAVTVRVDVSQIGRLLAGGWDASQHL